MKSGPAGIKTSACAGVISISFLDDEAASSNIGKSVFCLASSDAAVKLGLNLLILDAEEGRTKEETCLGRMEIRGGSAALTTLL